MRSASFVGRALLVTALALQGSLTAGRASAEATARDEIPPELRPWQGWALKGAEFLRCPYINGLNSGEPASRICHWVGSLRIDAGERGASFHENVRVYAPGWVTVPGDAERWPQGVRLDGSAIAIVERSGRPSLWIEQEGAYGITGDVPWTRLPDALSVPKNAGIVTLTVAGESVRDPEFRNGAIRLGAPATTPAEANNLELRIHRKLTDSLPGQLDTRLTLQVAGEAREEYFGPLLPAGFVPMSLQTALPARLESDGRLRVQVRPGTWLVELSARAPAALESIQVPAAAKKGIGEVWSYGSVDRLRVAAIEGAAPIDPAQANVPAEWQTLPAYQVEAGDNIRIVERSRGLSGQDLNRIAVQRDLWRDFAGTGYTFRDRLSGEMQQTWRVDMKQPYELQGARARDQPLLVTRGLAKNTAGVEWRAQAVDIEATGRVETQAGKLPASGWISRIADLAVTVHLPPGQRLVAAFGADRSPSAWLNRWQLLDIFVVLLVITAAFRVAGITAATVAGCALLLAHHEQPALTWLFLNLLIAIAIARAVPAGRFLAWARAWRNIAFALVGVALIPFTLYQARIAFFPQLETDAITMLQGVPSAQDIGPPIAQSPVTSERTQAKRAEAARMDSGAASDQASSPDIEFAATVRAPPPPTLERPRYAAGTVLQSGPGVPQWDYGAHRLEWSGPVEPGQSVRLVVLGPIVVSLWRLLACVLSVLLFVVLLREAYEHPRWAVLERWRPRRNATVPLVLALFAITLGAFAPPPVHAEPSPQILEQLQQRLREPPRCVPDCVSVAIATLRAPDDTTLEIELEAHAQTRAVLVVPAAARHWYVDSVRIGGSETGSVSRDEAGRMIVGLEPGVSTVTLRGRLAAADSIRIAFPQRPARVRIEAAPWVVTGVDDGRLLADSVTLTRRATAATGAVPVKRLSDEFPPFVRVTRRVSLGVDGWTASTEVTRMAPAQGAFTLELPLLTGESVLTANMPVHDGAVGVSMPADVGTVRWVSSLATVDELQLQAPDNAQWVETWLVDPDPLWRVSFAGTPEVFAAPGNRREALHRFEPRPAEKLTLHVIRPQPVPGPSFAFESVNHSVMMGQRARDVSLAIAYRSTQGGRHELQLPQAARLSSVSADGQPLALRAELGKLVLPLQPGAHQIDVSWQSDLGPGVIATPESVTLGAPASNVSTSITMPDNRWILFAVGGGVGPAVLYWAELLVFIALAVLLGRFAGSPLGTRDWLLVGLGLSTFSWSVLLVFATWVFAMQWRKRWQTPVAPWMFNLVQVGLVVLTVVALGSLVAAIPNGLLGTPDMRIAGAGSASHVLNWFHDRIENVLPQPTVISVSIGFYKAAMLAWALWLSFALVRWVRTAWEAFTAGRIWYSYDAVKAPAAAQATHDGT